MAWSDAARKAALAARRAKAITRGAQVGGVFKAVLYRAGPTTNPTGSGIRFAPKSSASTYGKLYKAPVQRYLVKIKNPFVAVDVWHAAEKLKIVRSGDAAAERAYRKSATYEKTWMQMDKKVHDVARKKNYGGLVYGGSGVKTPSWGSYHQLEVVAFNKLGQFRRLKKR